MPWLPFHNTKGHDTGERLMKIKTALLALALTSVGFAAQAAEVTVMS
jgi:hypothetical protein